MAGEKVQFSNQEFEVATVYYWLIILIALVLAVIVTALMSFYTITPGDSGVVVRLGKVIRINEPGIYWKLPWGIDRLHRIKVDYQYNAEFGFRSAEADSDIVSQGKFYRPEARLLTGDLKMIDLKWVVQYRVKDPVAYLFSVADPEQTIRTVGLTAMRTAVGDYSFHEVFQTERRAVAEMAKKHMQSKFDLYKMGIIIQHVQLKQAWPALPEPEPAPIVIHQSAMPIDSTRIDSVEKTW